MESRERINGSPTRVYGPAVVFLVAQRGVAQRNPYGNLLVVCFGLVAGCGQSRSRAGAICGNAKPRGRGGPGCRYGDPRAPFSAAAGEIVRGRPRGVDA